jgi:hypothetical protein
MNAACFHGRGARTETNLFWMFQVGVKMFFWQSAEGEKYFN